MKKTIIVAGLSFVILLGGYFLIGKIVQLSNTVFYPEEVQVANRTPLEKAKPALLKEELIDRIVNHAKDGMLQDINITVGQSERKDVEDTWGNSRNENLVEEITYLEYPEQDLVFGLSNEIVVDVRSFRNELQLIHLQDITTRLGEPNEERFYKDDTVEQIILVYQINGDFQLKWILNKPTKNEPNPTVHHISVVTELVEAQEVATMIENMTLKEKVGQMIIGGVSGTSLIKETESLLANYHLGGIIFYTDNFIDKAQSKEFIAKIIQYNEQQNELPLLLSVDQEGGRYTRLPDYELPINKDIGEINDPAYSFQIGQTVADQLIDYRLNMNYAPVLDIHSNPDNPVINERAFGSNAEIVSTLGIQTMKGMQSKQIIPVIKHFPGHGDTAVDSHLELPVVDKSLEELQKMELIPFTRAIDEGADVVMVAHILLPLLDHEYPATMSKTIITDLLREDLDFQGIVVTDDMTMKAITDHYDIGEAAVQSIKAGSDLILVAHESSNIIQSIETIVEAVETGELSEVRIDESVQRILELKEKYGLLE